MSPNKQGRWQLVTYKSVVLLDTGWRQHLIVPAIQFNTMHSVTGKEAFTMGPPLPTHTHTHTHTQTHTHPDSLTHTHTHTHTHTTKQTHTHTQMTEKQAAWERRHGM